MNTSLFFHVPISLLEPLLSSSQEDKSLKQLLTQELRFQLWNVGAWKKLLTLKKKITWTEKLFCHRISSFSSRFGISKSQHLTFLLIGLQTCFLASSNALIRRGLVTFNLLVNLPQLVTHLHWRKFSQGQFSSSFDSEKVQILLLYLYLTQLKPNYFRKQCSSSSLLLT